MKKPFYYFVFKRLLNKFFDKYIRGNKQADIEFISNINDKSQIILNRTRYYSNHMVTKDLKHLLNLVEEIIDDVQVEENMCDKDRNLVYLRYTIKYVTQKKYE